MDDYYELLGVDEGAPVDDIRAAYRDKKAAIDTSANDAAKADVAALNKAWNVLSDPYQRGRYDQQRTEVGDADDDGDYEEDDDEDGEAAPASRRRPPSKAAERAEKRRAARQPAKPTITLPAGEHFPTTRQRLIAMLIDLGVLFALVIVAAFVVSPAVDKAVHKPIVDRVDQLRKEFNSANDKADALDKAASAADKASGKTSSVAKDAHAAADHYRNHTLKSATNRFDAESKKLVPLNTSISAGALLIGLLYLVLPSARNGQTVGKRSQGIKVIRVDGSPLGFGWSVRRYGLILLATFLLVFVTPFGALGAALVLFGVTTWTRNPNHQGMHDRLVKTVVVTA